MGLLTSAVYSPRIERGIAPALMDADHAEPDMHAEAVTPAGQCFGGVVPKAIYDPGKQLAASA